MQNLISILYLIKAKNKFFLFFTFSFSIIIFVFYFYLISIQKINKIISNYYKSFPNIITKSKNPQKNNGIYWEYTTISSNNLFFNISDVGIIVTPCIKKNIYVSQSIYNLIKKSKLKTIEINIKYYFTNKKNIYKITIKFPKKSTKNIFQFLEKRKFMIFPASLFSNYKKFFNVFIDCNMKTNWNKNKILKGKQKLYKYDFLPKWLKPFVNKTTQFRINFKVKFIIIIICLISFFVFYSTFKPFFLITKKFIKEAYFWNNKSWIFCLSIILTFYFILINITIIQIINYYFF